MIQRGNEVHRIFYSKTCIEIEFSIDDVAVVHSLSWQV